VQFGADRRPLRNMLNQTPPQPSLLERRIVTCPACSNVTRTDLTTRRMLCPNVACRARLTITPSGEITTINEPAGAPIQATEPRHLTSPGQTQRHDGLAPRPRRAIADSVAQPPADEESVGEESLALTEAAREREETQRGSAPSDDVNVDSSGVPPWTDEPF
jgi:hypothetical protein